MHGASADAASAAGGMTFGLLAYASVEAGPDELPALRQNPGAFGGQAIPANQLKHVDDQTVLAVAAALRLAADPAVAERDLTDWATLAAPRFLGRANLAGQFAKFKAEGAWSMSPHAVPHRCLHSVSGTLSQLLKLRGPNFGCGGGPSGDSEAFLAAAALLACEPIPGCLLFLVGHSPEHLPDSAAQWRGYALALALLPKADAACIGQVRIAPPAKHGLGCRSPNESELLAKRLPPILKGISEGRMAPRELQPSGDGPEIQFHPALTAGPLRRQAA